MHSFQDVSVDLVEMNPFEKVGKDWMVVTAGSEKMSNAMTASWGGFGVMWGKNVAYVVIRHSRFTKTFIDRDKKFSLSFLSEKHRGLMKFLGTVSGRDEDKMREANVLVNFHKDVPFMDLADLVFICRVMSATEIKAEDFIDDNIDKQWYGDGDYHTMYIAEITDILAR